MDKALACIAGGPGLNPDMTKGFSAPILTGTPPQALSLSLFLKMHVVMCSRVNCHGVVKREESW